ncbi:MAG TPA: anhydro-N-acetylmuramic acid kinase [Candidatus Caenarcaniphilales bacterium]
MAQVIGLMSGTSVDGIDATLVEISGTQADLQVKLLSARTHPYSASLKEQILAVCAGAPLSMVQLAALDDAIAQEFAQAALAVQAGVVPADLIGSHGQTVYHQPPTATALGYSLQLGRGAVIAEITGIPTISNFRTADIAAGGQGAPLVPRVDVCLLSHSSRSRCIQNLGGIGNLAYLPAVQQPERLGAGVRGWDTGPGNVLLDLAVQQLSGGAQTYDRDGAWAASGTPCQELVNQWLQQPFFQQPPPKSTGRELFNLDYLKACLADAASARLTDPADLLATLTEFTVASIELNYQRFLPQMPDEVLLCGGGSHNYYLQQRLQARLATIPVLTTDEVGLSADYKEAIAFAVLAYWRQQGIPGNLPSVTGARRALPLGEVYG